MSEILNPDIARELSGKLRAVSVPFAKGCEYLGSAMRGKYLRLVDAIHNADSTAALGIIDEIRQSEFVAGLAGKLHDLRETVSEIRSKLGPFMQTIVGLSMIVAGALLLGEMALLAVLLMVGGLLIALAGLPVQMANRVTE